jgi:ligand-binding sensor domain-containing protein
MKHLIIWNICWLMLGLPLHVCAQQWQGNFKRFNVKDGLSNSSVWAIAQDQQGFMWFGTFDGLNV